MEKQCCWEGCCCSPDAAVKQLSAKLYSILALMPEAMCRQVEVVLRQVGVRDIPLWVPTGFAGAGCQKTRLIQLWQETCGEMHGERLAVILAALGLLGRGLVDGLPTAFACNNGMCRNLEGLGELVLVQDRAKVVCGGCRVAWYCCRECQEKGMPGHRAVCRHIRQNACKQRGGEPTSSRMPGSI